MLGQQNSSIGYFLWFALLFPFAGAFLLPVDTVAQGVVVPTASPTHSATAPQPSGTAAAAASTSAAVPPPAVTTVLIVNNPAPSGTVLPQEQIPIEETRSPEWTAVQKEARDRFGLYRIHLLGDAQTEISEEGRSSFAGGLEYRTLSYTLGVSIRAGSDQEALEDYESMGRFILAPTNSGRPTLDLDARFFPYTTIENFTGTTPHLGFHGYLQSSETNWRILVLGENRDYRGNVNVLGVGVGGRMIFASDTDNFIDVQGFIGPTMRVIGGDLALPNDVDEGQRALERALGSNQKIYVGGDIVQASFQIQVIRVGFGLSYFPEDVPGLSNFQTIATIQVRGGPSIPLTLPEDQKGGKKP